MLTMAEKFEDTRCAMCQCQLTVMKCCTRCRSVLYCSRDCQVKHWQDHKLNCLSKDDTLATARSKTSTIASQTPRRAYQRNDQSIFEDEEKTDNSRRCIDLQHPPLVDFSKAVKQSKTDNQFQQPEGKFYLHESEYHTDVPEIDENFPKSSIIVRCNKEKHKLCVQNSWTGEEIYKYLSHSLKIPVEKLKLIHKGKILNQDSVSSKIEDKAIFQVIGEIAESEEGIDQRDINIMMKQMGLERNAAVKLLKNKGDLIDALLD